MSLLEVAAFAVVALASLYLLALGVASLFAPQSASRFLLGFATSRTLHFTEMLLRIAVGASLVLHSPKMYAPSAFNLFGWVLIVTSTVLLLLPWRWHHGFAKRAVPLFTRHIALIGVVSLALGGLILGALTNGNAA